ncbi:YopX family protein [Tuberibacillus sp. Marseille-P3662]|uniref:YopX family protein n=1 Tax=Tuberibacillus sp. Marseille-P3662 TaxID=1965358 RepID=UPI000A1CD432|nr:YopX family protein [Tuberibacillus sp. Marseille-P3662]
MSNIKFRYIVRHKASGNIETKHYFLSQIEERPLKELSPAFLADYELLSRDQYTGLRDKNGVEVYEGDVLDCNGGIAVVFYSKRFVSYKLHFYSPFEQEQPFYFWDLEGFVIGNVYENPELLEVSADD